MKMMSSAGFLNSLLNFPKDTINEEIVELLEPYLDKEDYNLTVAKRVASDASGLLSWTRAMHSFFGVNKEVLPLKMNLSIQQKRLDAANKQLGGTLKSLGKKEKELGKVQKSYHGAVMEKGQIAKQAETCRKKMSAAV